MPPRPTIKDIAAECGVSLSTVSLVLNDNPRISDTTRNKVLETIKKRGYQPNHQARGLAAKSSNTLSIVVPQLTGGFTNIYLDELITGIHEATCAGPYKLMLEVANSNYIRDAEYLNTLKGRRADGMLFIGSKVSNRYLLEFENESYPFVLLNHYFPGSGLNFVSADYRQAGQLAAQHLLELGHKHIGIISDDDTYSALDQVDAFTAEYQSAGLSPENLALFQGSFCEEDAYQAAQQFLREHPQLTALVCGNGNTALSALRGAIGMGKSLPGDLSIIGMDDIPAGRYTSPQLTTIHTPLQKVGHMAATAVMNIFNAESHSIREFLPVHLERRGSTGPAPASA
jgi:LacI family transcriptional regulator